MVEKPARGTAQSNLYLNGRYILQPEIFDILSEQERGAGNEIQLTDAMLKLQGGRYDFAGRQTNVELRLDSRKLASRAVLDAGVGDIGLSGLDDDWSFEEVASSAGLAVALGLIAGPLGFLLGAGIGHAMGATARWEGAATDLRSKLATARDECIGNASGAIGESTQRTTAALRSAGRKLVQKHLGFKLKVASQSIDDWHARARNLQALRQRPLIPQLLSKKGAES